MAKLLLKGPTRIRAEVLDRRDEVSMWIARGTSDTGAFGTVGSLTLERGSGSSQIGRDSFLFKHMNSSR
jgi:hypothetical protein